MRASKRSFNARTVGSSWIAFSASLSAGSRACLADRRRSGHGPGSRCVRPGSRLADLAGQRRLQLLNQRFGARDTPLRRESGNAIHPSLQDSSVMFRANSRTGPLHASSAARLCPGVGGRLHDGRGVCLQRRSCAVGGGVALAGRPACRRTRRTALCLLTCAPLPAGSSRLPAAGMPASATASFPARYADRAPGRGRAGPGWPSGRTAAHLPAANTGQLLHRRPSHCAPGPGSSGTSCTSAIRCNISASSCRTFSRSRAWAASSRTMSSRRRGIAGRQRFNHVGNMRVVHAAHHLRHVRIVQRARHHRQWPGPAG